MGCMTDLQLIDWFIDSGGASMPDPRIFRHIMQRGLLWVVNTGLKGSHDEQKAIVRARLSTTGRYTGDPEIEHIAACVERIKAVQKEVASVDPTDASRVIELCGRLARLSKELIDFYK